jgi:hypothetical protein
MNPVAMLDAMHEDGVAVELSGAAVKLAGAAAAIARWRQIVVEHKADLMRALKSRAADVPLDANECVFKFAGAPLPDDEHEALLERAAIIAEGCRMDYVQALQEARWQAERERAWRIFRLNAERILAIQEIHRGAWLDRYEYEARLRYGASVARDMTEMMRKWIAQRSAR